MLGDEVREHWGDSNLTVGLWSLWGQEEVDPKEVRRNNVSTGRCEG